MQFLLGCAPTSSICQALGSQTCIVGPTGFVVVNADHRLVLAIWKPLHDLLERAAPLAFGQYPNIGDAHWCCLKMGSWCSGCRRGGGGWGLGRQWRWWCWSSCSKARSHRWLPAEWRWDGGDGWSMVGDGGDGTLSGGDRASTSCGATSISSRRTATGACHMVGGHPHGGGVGGSVGLVCGVAGWLGGWVVGWLGG